MARSDTLRLPSPTTTVSAPSREAGAFAAQVIGQPGVRRGLREGEPALARARTAYLSAEWRGTDDRRPDAGLLMRVSL